MSKQVPSIGRVVHFVSTKNGVHVPADICAVHLSGSVDLFVKDPTIGKNGIAFFTRSVVEDPTGIEPVTWHWPEFIPLAGE